MAFTLDKIVPWGRSFEEYVRMFSLTEIDLSRCILGCGDGPASFNAEATQRGHKVISCDPIYQFSASEIEKRIQETYDHIMAQLRKNQKDYVWQTITSPEELGQIRMCTMRQFLEDYPSGKKEGRYIAASLPSLPFRDKEFNLALCSHLLFTYSDQLSLDFHRASFIELCRVAEEVRVFPLLDMSGKKSAYVDAVVSDLRDIGQEVVFVKVPYEFQKGANTMMCVSSRGMCYGKF